MLSPPPFGMDEPQEAPHGSAFNTTVFVRNFPWSTTDADLAQLFSTVGKVVSVRAVHFKRPPYRPRGIAFVFMATPADAASAVNQLNNMPLGGRELMVQMAEPLPPTFGRNYTSRSVAAGTAPGGSDAQRVSSLAPSPWGWRSADRGLPGPAVLPGRRSLLAGDFTQRRACSSTAGAWDVPQMAGAALRLLRRL